MPFSPTNPLPLAVLISGQGSNLQAIIDAIAQGLPAEIRVVISNQPQAYGLERARKAGIHCSVVSHRDFSDVKSYDQALLHALQPYQPQLIILAGFMRILGKDFINAYPQRILNIHPSLLPKYPGLHTHQSVLNAGDKYHGSTVHIVTEQLDGGPIIAQARFALEKNTDAEMLKQRVQAIEHKLYPEVIKWYAEGRLTCTEKGVFIDGNPAPAGGLEF